LAIEKRSRARSAAWRSSSRVPGKGREHGVAVEVVAVAEAGQVAVRGANRQAGQQRQQGVEVVPFAVCRRAGRPV